MPLEFLAALVVAGLALAIGAVRFSGLSHPARLATATQAEQAFRLDYPDAEVREVLLSADSRAAILALGDGSIGLVEAFGAKFVTRRVDGGAIASLHGDGDVLDVRYRDFTHPAASYRFSDAGAASRARSWLGSAMTKENASNA
jgi:hypothetical protein